MPRLNWKDRVRWFCTLSIGPAALAAAMATSALSAPRVAEFDSNGGTWTVTIDPRGAGGQDSSGIVITPAVPAAETAALDPFDGPAQAPAEPGEPEVPAATPESEDAERAQNPVELAARYEQVYNSIPFIRSEYLANPNYRHEATIELLFGEMRPTVVHKGQAAIPANSGGVAPGSLPMGAPYFHPFAYPYGGALYASPWAGYGRRFGYFDFSRGPYSLYQRLFGYDGGWRSQFNINGGYGNPYAIWW